MQQQPEEEWRPVVGWEGLYEVSNYGRVRSLPRKTARGVRGGGILKPKLTKGRPPHGRGGGYLYVLLQGAPLRPRIHQRIQRLVLEAFVGACPRGHIARHYPDHTPGNCHLNNLSWATVAQNSQDAIECGAQPRGERHGEAKLTEREARSLIEERRRGVKLADLATRYGISFQHVSLIAKGKRWSWLKT